MPYKPDDKAAAAALRRGLAKRIRAARLGLGLSQEALADAVGIGSEMLGRYERALKFPSHLTLIRLAEALGTTTDELLGVDLADARKPRPSPFVRGFERLSHAQRALVLALMRELEARELRRRSG
jgi:transcriptional regulator with XRE-family HTH domain